MAGSESSALAGDHFAPALVQELPLLPPPVSGKILSPPAIDPDRELAGSSALITGSAAAAMSNSAAAGYAVDMLTRPGENVVENGTGRKDRERLWTEKRNEIDGLGDGLGLGIDEGIKETVVALQLNGISTSASCEGHVNRGCGTPWVDVEAMGRPGNLFEGLKDSLCIIHRYEGEEEIYRQVAARHGISVEEMMKRENFDRHFEVRREAFREAYSKGETEEFKAWAEANRSLYSEMHHVLDTYYDARQVPGEGKFGFYPDESPRFGFGFRIYTGPEEDQLKDSRERTDEEKKALALRLPRSRKAMENFTLYLKEHYLAEGPLAAKH